MSPATDGSWISFFLRCMADEHHAGLRAVPVADRPGRGTHGRYDGRQGIVQGGQVLLDVRQQWPGTASKSPAGQSASAVSNNFR